MRTRRPVLLLFGISFLAVVPVWWELTLVYRAPLPFNEMQVNPHPPFTHPHTGARRPLTPLPPRLPAPTHHPPPTATRRPSREHCTS
jgi:hypothetical protein